MKKWLTDRFLPMWARETLLRENQSLHRENRELEQACRTLRAYARGLELGLRAIKRWKGGDKT